jgi:hypothetical protein
MLALTQAESSALEERESGPAPILVKISAERPPARLGPVRLELSRPDIGRPFYRAVTILEALALIAGAFVCLPQ